MFEGLLFYEIILLVLGVVLFLMGLGLLVYFVVKERPIKNLAWVFGLSVVMMGYSGSQKISFLNGLFEIEKLTNQLSDDTSNAEAKEELSRQVSRLERRSFSSPQTQLKLAKAHHVLGQETQALTYVKSALKVKPNLSEALELQTLLTRPREIPGVILPTTPRRIDRRPASDITP